MAIGVPAVRAQRNIPAASSPRDARTVAQNKIAPRVLSEIYRRRGDARQRSVPAGRGSVPVDRHGRVLVDVRADVRPALEKKIKALGGIIVSSSAASRSIVGWLPLMTLERLAADPSVSAIDLAVH
ncbi:MAG: hypothetical protein DMF84_14440 [Acidobacteria bacterium]|nr:MAG: hypothetical protein DMF84_14440 [Acidobacteriota bacterium]